MTPNCAPAFNTPQDPRLRGDFVPEHYPRANGKDAPPLGAVEQNEVIILAFLAAYYELNRAYAHLLEARGRVPSPERTQAEREGLQAIERTLILRDELEDHYAPRGVIVEPIGRNGFTVDLKVSFGNVDAAGRTRTDLYTITAYCPIPMPAGVKFQDVVTSVEGPGCNGEY